MVNYGQPGRLVYVDTYGADPSGVNDSTAAFALAQSALGGNPGELVLSRGTYVIGTAADLGTFGRGQGMTGQGSALTTITYKGNSICVNAWDSSFSSSASIGGRFGGFTISGSTAGASAVGMRWGDMARARCNDISISGFTGASAVGLHLNNVNGWSEQGEWTAINLVGCTSHVFFDAASWDYSLYQFLIVASAGQDGVRFENGASLEGCRLEVRGNFTCGTQSGAAVLAFDRGNSSGTARIDGCQLYISVEADGNTGTGHTSILMAGGASSQFNGEGVIQFRDGGSNGFSAPSIASTVPSSNVWASGLVSYSGQQVTYTDPGWQASDYGYAGITIDPGSASGTVQLTAGTIYVWSVLVRYPRRVSSVIIPTATTAGAGETAGQNFVGLYDSGGNRLAQTAVDATFNVSFTAVSVAITAQTLKPGLYWIAFLLNATTMPSLCRGSGISAVVVNMTLGAASSRFATAGTAQTALPATFTPSALAGSTHSILAALT